MPTRVRVQPVVGTNDDLREQFGVVVHHDSRHTFRYCKSLLMQVFGLDDDAACTHCWTITTQGKAVVWIGKYNDAEQYCRRIAEFQESLNAQNALKPDAVVDAGHPPLRTTIECVLQGT